nr:MAG TPA: hypothetical protein [Caudoviricetes sp.]
MRTWLAYGSLQFFLMLKRYYQTSFSIVGKIFLWIAFLMLAQGMITTVVRYCLS